MCSQISDFDRLPQSYQEMLDVIQGVIPLTINSVLASIDAIFATREACLEQECGVDADGLAQLRERFPEPRSLFSSNRTWR